MKALTLVAAACSAVLFFFGTGLTPVPALAWLAPLPVLLAAPRASGWTAGGAAFLASLVGTTNSWAFYSHSHDMPLWPWGLVGSLAFAATLLFAVLVFRGLVLRGRALLAAVCAPAVWTAVLFVIAETNPTGIMGTLATTQADVPVVLQTASVLGSWGVEYLVFLVPSTLAAIASPAVSRAARLRTGAVVAVAVTTALGLGVFRLADKESGPAQRVALVASNQKGWAADVDTTQGRAVLAAYVDEIAALPDGVRTVVLPEAAFGSREAMPTTVSEPMRGLAKTKGFDIVVGYAHWAEHAKYNLAWTFPASGEAPIRYLKHHDTVSPAGDDLVFAPSPGVRVGVAVCMDVNFRDPSQDYAAAGAGLLAIPASDEDDNGWQHSRTALLRGVENGMAIAWGGRQTTHMIADSKGRVLAEARTDGPKPFVTVVGDVATGFGPTLYTRFGDWFAWACLALAAAGLLGCRAPRA
ncbi:nitrilase-related carbon-nitrogen hydrolase [Allokutzneria oryzae]|uniref:Nitrilase-related carbon-nitrogen hydrolase n=1 Tax=Allokutzneria oryzae TaxID=1378989 RepID=A0ABV6A5R3_9PSEU